MKAVGINGYTTTDKSVVDCIIPDTIGVVYGNVISCAKDRYRTLNTIRKL